tara:strand:- start:436 stop:1350 length:915 start_codon:yes stop_codon:yes gene_type:complete
MEHNMEAEVKEEVKEEEGQVIELEEQETKPQQQELFDKEEAPKEEAPKEDQSAKEMEEYSKSVQQRINKLTRKYRDEESEKQAAIDYAESVKKQNEELKKRLDDLDQSYVGQFGDRIESQIQAAKQAFKTAHEAGDADAMFTAQQELSRLAVDQSNLDARKIQKQKQAEAAPTPGPAAPTPQQTPKKPDPRAEQWAKENEWFGTDQTMTYAAFGLHRQLIEQEGFDPATEEYYSELDKRLRTEFPQKFKETKNVDVGPRVASAESTASKQSSKKRRTVKLTPSQIAIAKRLNVPLEEYAKYVKE